MRRVAVTGVGLVSPLGLDRESSWSALIAGVSGIGPITLFDAGALDSRIAGEVKGFDPTRWLPAREAKTLDRYALLAVAAGAMALNDAGLERGTVPPDRMACIIGSGLGGAATLEQGVLSAARKGHRLGLSPFFVPALLASTAAAVVGKHCGALGATFAPVTACASGAHAIGLGLRTVQHGDADVAICGGAEASVVAAGVGGFCALRALSRRNDAPREASRPFDRERDGFVIAEGAGVIVLEELELARARGAQIYALLTGYGASAEGYHLTAISPDGTGAQSSMRKALADARCPPDDIGYINAHGTGTRLNDAIESHAIHEVFGRHAETLMVSSTKSMTGHMLGAAGAVEAGFTCLALQRGVVPPTINYQNPDDQCAQTLDYVPNAARTVPLKAALSNSFGFGGLNASLLFEAA